MPIQSEIRGYIEQIKSNRNQGASELARQSLEVLKVAIAKSTAVTKPQFILDINEISASLYSARPVMAPIKNVIKLFQKQLSANNSNDLNITKKTAISIADNIIKTSQEAVNKIAEYAKSVLTNNDVIMTQSFSSTVAYAFKVASQNYKLNAIVTRSGTSKIGQITAQEIQSYGVRVTYIDDTAVGLYINQVKKVFVGADRICSDGILVNGVGTFLMALAANKYQIPVYVLSESLKIDPNLKGNEADLEDKNPNEMVIQGVFKPEIIVKNPYFDITPVELITALITEDGIIPQSEISAYIQKLAG
ncbi:MAG TPA: translation initiation factor eIF-2B [Dehalococcoidales bacterium]|jgi:Translation initiation factor 2B subunit, eIF-2B alpha/beta/delta family